MVQYRGRACYAAQFSTPGEMGCSRLRPVAPARWTLTSRHACPSHSSAEQRFMQIRAIGDASIVEPQCNAECSRSAARPEGPFCASPVRANRTRHCTAHTAHTAHTALHDDSAVEGTARWSARRYSPRPWRSAQPSILLVVWVASSCTIDERCFLRFYPWRCLKKRSAF